MRFVTLLLAIISLMACKIRTPESKEKFTPKEEKLNHDYGFFMGSLSDGTKYLLGMYLLAKPNRSGFSNQLFAIFPKYGSVPGVHVRAIDNNFMPLKQNDCIDEFRDLDQAVYADSLELERWGKSIRLKFKEKNINSMIMEFEYTTKDTNEVDVTYQYKKPKDLTPGTVALSYDHGKKLERGDSCVTYEADEKQNSG